jgi:hypothetical protein
MQPLSDLRFDFMVLAIQKSFRVVPTASGTGSHRYSC